MNTNIQQFSSQDISLKELELSEIIQDIFMVLTTKEKDVIVKRFSLDNEPKMTLERIGKKFSVTRERIRQIEKIALNKLRRTVKNTKLHVVNNLTTEYIKKEGGVSLEDKVVSYILKAIGSQEGLDTHIIKLSLNINPDLDKIEKSSMYNPFWKLSNLPLNYINDPIRVGMSVLNKKGDVLKKDELIAKIQNSTDTPEDIQPNTIYSALEVDKRIKKVKDGFGLMKWRHVNPKSIRDKAYIVLKESNEPLHFIEIANKISEAGFDRKVVTTQAVHNELIRYEQFVLVGRGLYALKEWGFSKGTVADVIEKLLKENNAPMTKKEIIEGVLNQRKVKKGTISLNLQKNPQFIRVGRAVYELKSN